MKYAVDIIETFSQTVIVDAEDQYDAQEKVESLCNSGGIDLAASACLDRQVGGVAEATKEDEQTYEYIKE